MSFEKLKKRVVGVNVVVITPFKEDKTLDEEGLRENLRFMMDNGLVEGNGVFIIGGSTGELFSMKVEERKRIFKIAVDEVNGKAPVFCGCNHSGTDIVIELARFAEDVGADGVMVTPPYYWTAPDDETVFRHYKALGEKINIGIMIYNNPFIVNKDLSVELVKRMIAEIPNLVAIKECSIDLLKFERMLREVGDKISFINGNGEFIEPYAYMMGSVGYISGIANFMPKEAVELHKNCLKGDYEKGKQYHLRLAPYLDFLLSVTSGNAITVLKETMNILGRPAGPVRPPLIPLTPEQKETLKNILKKMGLL